MKKEVLIYCLLATLIGILSFLTFKAFESEKIYSHTLGRVSTNYVNNDGRISCEHVPLKKITNENLEHWDVSHYKCMSITFYAYTPRFKQWLFAFYPLFPLYWKLTGFNCIGITILNYLLFSAALIILMLSISSIPFALKYLILSIALLLPTTLPYIIPYSEALYIFTFAIAYYGYMKDKYWVYFIFIFLFTITRAASLMAIIAFICSDIYFVLLSKGGRVKIKDAISRLIPLLFGTLIVWSIDYYYTGNFFQFFEAHKTWANNHQFGLNLSLSDWTNEGFGMSFFCLVILLPTVLFILLRRVYRTLFSKQESTICGLVEVKKDYLYVVAVFYIIICIAYILLFKNGSINGLQRYVMATPFFYVFFFTAVNRLLEIKHWKRFVFAATFVVFSAVLLWIRHYNLLAFPSLGYYILILVLLLFSFMKMNITKTTLVLFCVIVILCLIWRAYTMNMLLSNAWIIT